MSRKNRHTIARAPRAYDSGQVGKAVAWSPPELGAVYRGKAAEALLERSTDSKAMLPYWDMTDAIIDGADAVRAAGEKFLPKFADETGDEYAFRLSQTKYTNIYRDIIENLASKPFQEDVSLPTTKDGKITAPSQIVEFIENVDGAGTHLTGFAANTFFNGINSAVDWIFVDFPTVDAKVVRTVADAKREGIRPFWSHVLARNVLDVQCEMINGSETLTHMRIMEPGKPDHMRMFHRDAVTGEVHWVLFEIDVQSTSTEKVIKVVGVGIVTIGVIPLVPYSTGRRDGRSYRYFPVMRDAADLQKELYQQESGLKFTKVLTAYPMLTGNGVRPEKDPAGKPIRIAIGPARVLYAPPGGDGKHGEWKFIQPDASTLTFLAADIKSTIENLRELGRQPLTAQSGNITVITSAIAAGKAKTAVGAWAMTLKNTLENALVLTALWYGMSKAEYDPEVSLFMDFDEVGDKSGEVAELRQARNKGDLSQPTYWEELKRRGILSSEFTAEREIERLLADVPVDKTEPDDDTGEPDDENSPPGEPKPAA